MLKYRENEGIKWLDNLKLGYGGTKTEMERLLADAEKISGIHYDISNLDDVYKAIHVIQGELGITGTTAKEASETLQGSAASMKAAFTNFLSGAGGIEEVITTVETFSNNLVKAITELAPKIVQGTIQIVKTLIKSLPPLLKSLLPTIAKGIIDLVKGIAEVLPTLINTVLKLATEIITIVAKELPKLIPMLVDSILSIIPILISNIPAISAAFFQLLSGATQGIAKALPIIVSYIPKIINGIVDSATDTENLTTIISAIIEINNAIAEAFILLLPELIKIIPDIIFGLFNTFIRLTTETDWGKIANEVVKSYMKGLNKLKDSAIKSFNDTKNTMWNKALDMANKILEIVPKFTEIGKNIIQGLINGIKSKFTNAINSMSNLGNSMLNTIQKKLGIHSPSTKFAWIAEMSISGFTKQLDNMKKQVRDTIDSTFSISPQLTGSMQNSYSPNVQVYNNVNVEQDPLGQMVSSIKTFSGGAKNDYNYGSGI